MNFDKLQRTVGRLTFRNPLVYGGGTLKIIEDVEKMCKSAAAGGEIGTITSHSKGGNSGDTFYAHFVKGVLIYTLNSLGLRNPGKDYWTLQAAEAIQMAHDAGKLLGINIAGDTVKEIVEMYLWAEDLGFDWITINAGCPNKWLEVDGKQIPQAILSCDSGDTEELMTVLDRRAVGSEVETWWKPSPDNDTLGTQVKHADLVAQCHIITGWIANNTVPHCFAWEEKGKPAITPGGGLAGMAGPAVKPKALGDIRRLRKQLPKRIHMIGAGGVTYGTDILDYLKVDASIVHFASALWAAHFDHNVSGTMLGQLCDLPEAEAFLEAA